MNWDFLIRKLNFLSFDLKVKCEGLKDADRIHVLNDLFFGQQNFNAKFCNSPQWEELSFSHLFTNKSSDVFLITLLYQFLANQINLPIYTINLEPLHIVKWVNKSQNCYIDIYSHGKTFTQQELLKTLHQRKLNQQSFEILTIKQLFIIYLHRVFESLKESNDVFKPITCLNLILEADENNLEALKYRGLLYFKCQQYNEALKDLKKYFVYVDLTCASPEVQSVYQKLLEIKKAEAVFNDNNLLH